MRILVTGSRTWPDDLPHMIHAVLEGLRNGVAGRTMTVVVGYDPDRDYPWGVDRIAYRWADMFAATEPYPADWNRHGKAAGPVRNQAMVDSDADLCLAFFNGPEADSRGTSDCRRRAKAAGIPTYTIRREPARPTLSDS